VFYTPSTLTVNAGDKVVGRLSCSPNARNNRDLDIAIAYRNEGDAIENHVQYKMCVLSYFPILVWFRKTRLFGYVYGRTYANQLSGLNFLLAMPTHEHLHYSAFFIYSATHTHTHHLQLQNCKKPFPHKPISQIWIMERDAYNAYLILQVLITVFLLSWPVIYLRVMSVSLLCRTNL